MADKTEPICNRCLLGLLLWYNNPTIEIQRCHFALSCAWLGKTDSNEQSELERSVAFLSKERKRFADETDSNEQSELERSVAVM